MRARRSGQGGAAPRSVSQIAAILLLAANDAKGQLQNCDSQRTIKIFVHWKKLVSRISLPGGQPPMTHEVIRELEFREDAETLKALAQAAASDDQFLRRTAMEVIGRHPQGRELRTIILSAFGDPSEYVVRTACDVVALWGLNEAHKLVAALLTNASKVTRQTAIRALGTLWVDADFPLIFGIYTSASEIDVRREAAWVLRRRVTSAHWRTLFDAFYVDELPRHRQWACELAENFSGPDILPVLSQLSLDVDGHVRKAASQAIQTLSCRK
jgi:HEAT repeat protein